MEVRLFFVTFVAMRRFEVCCGDIESLIEAHRGGAMRVELCTGLAEGGLTPPASLIRYARKLGIPQINVLIRPRQGDFLYTSSEKELMLEDIAEARLNGATGVVVGALNEDGTIDQEWLNRVMEAKGEMSVTFHRAFDMCVNPVAGLETIVAAGCDCILTSGAAQNAMQGVEMIRQLVQHSAGRIDIMAGCGVTKHNVREIAEYSGVPVLHSTARGVRSSGMKFHRSSVNMGASVNEYSRLVTDARHVSEIISILSQID